MSFQDTEAPWHAVKLVYPPVPSHAHSSQSIPPSIHSLPLWQCVGWSISLWKALQHWKDRKQINKEINKTRKVCFVVTSLALILSPGVSCQLRVVCFQINPPYPLFLLFPESIPYLPPFDFSLTPIPISLFLSSLPSRPSLKHAEKWASA